MFFLWIIVIIVISVLVAKVGIGAGSRGPDVPEHKPDALEILNRRYARGEIAKAEYMERRQDITR